MRFIYPSQCQQFVATLVFMLACISIHADVSPFTRQTLESMEKNNIGRPWLLVIWSIDCAPCYKELDLLAKLGQQYDDLKIELVSTDAPGNRSDVERVLQSRHLESINSWQYGPQSSISLQYSVDPQWRGELPRNYFYRADGSRCAMSGALNPKIVSDWLRASAEGATTSC